MTERQKNKVDGIIKLTISSFEVADVFPESIARDLVISLAKVFNIDITKEKADYIVDEIIKNEPIIYDSGYEALAYIIERIGWITAEYFDSEKNINNLDSYINDKFMIEEQKRKCEEIINDYKIKLGDVDISLLINPFSSIFQSINQYAVENITYMTISLAKVFNKDITEEEAKKIVSVLKDTEKRQDIESIGWAIANYFLPRKIEKIINSYEEKYKKEFKEINTLGFHIDGQHTSPIVRMFGIIVAGISFFEFEFGQSEEYLNEYTEFLVKSNNIVGENIIDLTVALSEVFNRNMTKEEAEKLLFTKDIEEDWQSKHSDKFYKSTKEFEYIIELYIKNSPFYNSELDTIFSFGMLPHNINLYMFIFKSVGWAIANYFNGKENNNNKNEEKNKNFNKENQINNVVENTAKEKIMIAKDYNQYKKEVLDLYNDYVKTFESFGKKVDESVSKTADKIKKEVFNLMVLGEAKSGKSTFINAYLGEEILPMDELQCTSSIIEIKRGDKFELKAQKASGDEIIKTEFNEITEFLQTHAAIPDEYRNIPITTINNWLLEYKDKKILENDKKGFLNKKEVKEANIFKIDEKEYKDLICKYINENASKWKEIIIKIEITYTLPEAMQGITIIDSPGVGAGGNVGKITEDYIEKADAIIFIKSLVGQALENNSFQELIRNKITNKKKELMFLVFTGKCRDLNDLGFEKLKHKAIEMYKNDIDKEKILFVDSKIQLFLNKCLKLDTSEKIKDFFENLNKTGDNFESAENIWLKSYGDVYKFENNMEEKSNFNSVNKAINKFARQANYLQLIEFLQSLNNEYKNRKATISELLQELKENIKDPIELERRIKKKEKEKTDMFNKSNEGINTIFNKYTDNINGYIAKETQELEENYKNEINKFINLEEWQIENQTFDEMKKITMDTIEASKQFRDLMIRTAIKDCNEKLIEYMDENDVEIFAPNFTESDFDNINNLAKEEHSGYKYVEEGVTFKKTTQVLYHNRKAHLKTITNSIKERLYKGYITKDEDGETKQHKGIIEEIKDNIIDNLNSCRTIYTEKLTENFNAIKKEYEDLLKDKDDNEKNLQKIKDFEDKIEKIENHLKNINNLKEEIENYVN